MNLKNNSDLIFHSCGFDKRPNGLFGGYVQIKKTHTNIISEIIDSIKQLKEPSYTDIFKKVNDVNLLYIIYNIRFIQNILKVVLNLLSISISNFIIKVRKEKPGFDHNNFMKKPTSFMINTMIQKYNTQEYIENLFIKKNKLFLLQFTDDQILKYFILKKNEESCLPYNIILISKENQDNFINFFDKCNICILKIPHIKHLLNLIKI